MSACTAPDEICADAMSDEGHETHVGKFLGCESVEVKAFLQHFCSVPRSVLRTFLCPPLFAESTVTLSISKKKEKNILYVTHAHTASVLAMAALVELCVCISHNVKDTYGISKLRVLIKLGIK
ncbi:hypothetical protein OUZ56_005453 [Daphnia magna]|uniref:Uncharacterized protein n=1 Tax=Daphnia magna TaxID=35525 RepID=A0ABQ9YSU0_9CRUS|nr:hypothetical protein OUZ56_005453 [Daphnia magna]